MKKNWNREDWQGRSRHQVETNYKIQVVSLVGLAICFLVILINNLI